MGEHFDIIMTEFCNRVNADWKEIDPKKEGWYKQYSWTVEEQKSFADWMIKYLLNSSAARKEIMAYPSSGKKKVTKTVWHFLFNYGWTTK